MKILIVDDEELDLFITTKLLSLEYQVQGFTTVPDTLNWAKDNPFDVVLIDYYLNNGQYAYHVYNELAALKGTPFTAYVLSSHVDDAQRRELKKIGFKDIIEKPITLDKFKSFVNN